MRIIACILIVIIFSNCGYSQRGISYQAGISYGVIMKGEPNKVNAIWGINFDINKKTRGDKYWQSDNKYPQMGIKIGAVKLNNYDGLRYSVSAIPYLEFNLLNLDIGQLQLKHGTGLAYVAGRFDSKTDLILGSKLNATSILDLGFNFDKGNNYQFKTGILLSHISNGNLVSPNSGLNSLNLYLQCNFFPGSKVYEHIPHVKNVSFKRWGGEGRISTGLSNYIKDQNSVDVTYQVLSMITYQHTTRFRTGAGLEIITSDIRDNIKFAFYVEESACIAHLVTHYGLGYEFAGSPGIKRRIYEKVGIAWFPFKLQNEIGNGLYLGANIKAYKFKAAHIDVSVGYLFGKL